MRHKKKAIGLALIAALALSACGSKKESGGTTETTAAATETTAAATPTDRKSTRLNSSHSQQSRMPSSA